MERNNCPFFIPNLGKNCWLEEKSKGLRLFYVLACPKDYPLKSFTKHNVNYAKVSIFIPYQPNMSSIILRRYYYLKEALMLDIRKYKITVLEREIKTLNITTKQINTI